MIQQRAAHEKRLSMKEFHDKRYIKILNSLGMICSFDNSEYLARDENFRRADFSSERFENQS